MQAASATSFNFMVATDGSPASLLAFQVVTESLMHPTDKILVSHIYNKEKAYLPFDMQPDNLKKTYEALTLPLGARAHLWWEEADYKLSTKEHMINLASKAQANLLVIGMHGRKGPKA